MSLTNVPEHTDRSDVDLANDIMEVIDGTAVVSPDGVSRIGRPRGGSRV